MSHFTSIKTKITDIQALRRAVKELGYELVANERVRGFNLSEPVDYVVRLKGSYDVGLKKNASGSYDLVVDWWGGHVAAELGEGAGKLLQAYSYHKVALEARKRGYSVTHSKQRDGTIKVVIRGF